MENIKTPADLKNAILLLEAEQAIHLQNLRKQFFLTYESLKPAKLIENTLRDIASSPYLVNNILATFVGLLSGYISKKAVTSQSSSKLRKLFGYLLQFGITNLVAQNPETIKSFVSYISEHIFHKRGMNDQNREG
ncbi:MAG: hypothetical protein Q7J34_09200 [Bacteroidales bacterium]|jgi:hypothetical protein|nr:hypothetical protein [Bacteroidales bacterium]